MDKRTEIKGKKETKTKKTRQNYELKLKNDEKSYPQKQECSVIQDTTKYTCVTLDAFCTSRYRIIQNEMKKDC